MQEGGGVGKNPTSEKYLRVKSTKNKEQNTYLSIFG